MAKIKDIITVLNNYQKIIKLVEGNEAVEIEEFINLLKGYRQMGITEFKEKLEKNQPCKKKVTNSPKNQALQLGKIYYNKNKGNYDSDKERQELMIYLSLPENKILNSILNESFEKRFLFIRDLKETALTGNQLFFLGMALLNIKLKGSNKASQKKNLLDILWTVSENQEMNEIYESVL